MHEGVDHNFPVKALLYIKQIKRHFLTGKICLCRTFRYKNTIRTLGYLTVIFSGVLLIKDSEHQHGGHSKQYQNNNRIFQCRFHCQKGLVKSLNLWEILSLSEMTGYWIPQLIFRSGSFHKILPSDALLYMLVHL